MTDLYSGTGVHVEHDMLDIDAAARQALELAKASGERHTAYTVVELLPFAETGPRVDALGGALEPGRDPARLWSEAMTRRTRSLLVIAAVFVLLGVRL